MFLPRGKYTHKGPGTKEIPGVTPYGKYTLDAAVAAGLAEAPTVELAVGLDPRLRTYQQYGASWLLQRGYGILGLPPQTGKTITAIMAAKALGTRRLLVLCPAGARGVWAREIERWLGISPVLLFGRGGDCVRPYGNRWYAYRDKDKTAPIFEDLLHNAPILICNYEIIGPQHTRNSAGAESQREDLPGWEQTLAGLQFDVAILDETHEFRGWTSTRKTMLWQRIQRSIQGAKRAWGLTGTPFCGYKKDIWAQLQVLSGGLYGYRNTPFSWHARYCDGHKGEFGWVATGSSNEEEHNKRMRVLIHQPTMHELIPDLPPKTRTIIPIENDQNLCTGATGTTPAVAQKLSARTLKHKLPVCKDKVLEALRCGQKTIIYTMWRESADKVFEEIQKVVNKNNSKHLKGVRFWRGTGSDDCDKVAEQFRAHEGPGVLVGTTQAWKGYRNLQGALTIHVLEVDHDPGAMLQAENRPYAKDRNGLTVFYYEVENSIDTHMIKRIVRKLEALDGVADTGLTELSQQDTGKSLLDDVFASMMEMVC